MKLAIFFLLTWFAPYLTAVDTVLQVSSTSSDAQIRETERQVLQQYGVKVVVSVIERNAKGEITNLKCVRYNKTGKEGGACSSDKFGLLVITQAGCKIADLGHEDRIKNH